MITSKLTKLLFCFVFICFFTNINALAVVKLPSVFDDSMILQQDCKVNVWGWAKPGEKITIFGSWQNSAIKTEADENGDWKVCIKTPKAGGPYNLTIEGENKIEISNILMGEVWLCGGQSNMQRFIRGAKNGYAEIAEANYPMIRLFTVNRTYTLEPQKNLVSEENKQWIICNTDRDTTGLFSAVGYFFGRELHKKLNVPIGLIDTSIGGTPIQAWMKRDVLMSEPNFKRVFSKYDPNNLTHKNPTCLYNGMIAPLIPFTMKGVIWYQGESNAWGAYEYRRLFPAMINSWRKEWGQGDFPFYYVQIANYFKHDPKLAATQQMPEKGEPSDSTWAELREAQLMALSLPKTGMVVTIDIGEPYDIHPKNKQDVGKRLALWALAKEYNHKDLVYSGPLYEKHEIQGNKIRIYFKYTASGLVVEGDKLEGFAIAGKDKKFVWANAEVDGNTVLIWSDEIEKPVAVRYAWSNWAYCNLFNKEGLPASPFRTDDWPEITINAR